MDPQFRLWLVQLTERKSHWLVNQLVTHSSEIAAKSFVETAEAEGATVDTVYPEAATADAQIKVLDNPISLRTTMQFASLQTM